jgi:N-acetylglutamate synthase-like GNAT family acetyltransferase
MKIHSFKESDAEAVAGLSNENSFAFQHARVTPSFLRRMCAHKTYKMFVLKDGGEIVGFCGVNYRSKRTPELGPICVKNGRRMHGLGRLLVMRVFEFVGPLGCQKLWVKAKASNRVAQKFFRSMGFKKAGEVSVRGVPAVIMDYSF